jgi:TctA family transporter
MKNEFLFRLGTGQQGHQPVESGPGLLQTTAEILYAFFIGFILVNRLILLAGHGFVQIGHSIIRTAEWDQAAPMPLKQIATSPSQVSFSQM